jgi:Tol biopolymer transport system component
MRFPPGTCIGAYELVAPLGAGGMGEVYRARDTRLERTVALKVLPPEFADPDARARFEREARAIAAFNHPNICTLHDFGCANGLDFLVMELLDGETLAARLARGPLSLEHAIAVAQQIADALDRAHSAGIVHRDLKPANVVVLRGSGRPTVKLLDFGLAKVSARPVVFGANTMTAALPSPTIAPLTSAGTILGTLHYMSPEQVEGKDADHRSDIFALGCVIYEMVTGTRAFSGETPASTMAAILERRPPPASTQSGVAPAWLDWIIQTALAKDPGDRWQSAGDLARMLGELPRVTDGRVPSPAWSARPFVLGAAILASIALAAVSLFLWTQRATPAAPPPLARLAVSTVPAMEVANTQGGSVAISPDGNVIAFVGARDGVRALYLRHLDQPDALELANTQAATGPVFSPDGQSLVYTHDQGSSGSRLMKVSVATGAMTTIVSLSEAPRGTVVMRGGDIIFGSAAGPLRRVNGAGGEAVPLAPLSAGEEAHRWPALLPDDEHVVFAAGAPTLSRWDVAPLYVQNVRTGERRALDLQGTFPRFIAPKRLIFNRDNRLFFVGFDPQSLTVTGAPTAVLENVTNLWNTGAAQYDISRSGTLLFPAPDNTTGVNMARIGSHAGEEALPVAKRGYTAPVISSNGRYAAVEIVDDADDIWVVNLETGAPQRLTFNTDEDETPVWSPDNVWVAYASTRGGSRQILRRRADGGGSEETLWKGTEHTHVNDWTPDGRSLLISGVSDNKGQGLSLLDLGSTPPAVRSFMPGRTLIRSAHLSRDGRWIVYASGESGRDEIYVQDFPQLASRWQVSQNGGLNPLWTTDSKALYYRRGATLYRVPVEQVGMALKFGVATQISTALPALKGDHRPFGVFPNGDALVLKGASGDRSDHLNLFQHWTVHGLGTRE